MRTKRFLLAGLLPALLFTGVAAAQDVPLDVEIGYRFSDVNGNEEMFRSQLDEEAGLQLRSLSWGLGDIRDKKYIDHFRIDAADLGAGPNGLLRVEAGRTGLWKLNASWRRTERYSNLPTIANPFLGSGVLDSQHAYDRTRNSVDVDLELLPGKKIRPLVGFSYSRLSGPGMTTYHVGQDEFALSQDLEEKDTEYRIGVAFDAGAFSGQVVQGWRSFKGEETLRLSPGAGAGNNPGTILGVPITMTSLSRASATDIDTPVTSAVVSGKLGSAVRITGTYVRAKAEGDDSSSENLSGDLVSYEVLRFFKSLAESSTATSEALSWRGSIRADVHVASGLDVSAGYTRRIRELDGFGLVNDLYGTTTTFSGFDPRDVTTILESRTRMERDEDIFDLRASVKLGKPLTFRLGISQNDADIDVRNDPSEIVVPGAQGGRYGRRVFGIDAGFAFKHEGLALGFDFNRQTSDDAVLRTDFLERDRLRLRGTWEAAKWLRIGATAERVDTSNNDFGYGYGLEGEMNTYAGDVEIGPLEWLRFRFGAGRFEGDSSIGYRQPQDFVDATSVYRERGDSLEGGVSVNFKPFTLEALLRRFENDGSFPYELDRARVRASYDVTKLFGVAAEWDLDDYTEKDRSYGSGADFKANRYGLYLRIHP
jgi:hypothetical protein